MTNRSASSSPPSLTSATVTRRRCSCGLFVANGPLARLHRCRDLPDYEKQRATAYWIAPCRPDRAPYWHDLQFVLCST